jgi:tetratricopeptide (TPR) repeat protein
LLGWIAAQSFAALRRTSNTRAACGLGVLAFLGAGLVNAPLMAGVAAPAVALPLLGALVAPNKFSARSKSLGPEGMILVLALALAQPAWEFVQHGRALGELGQAKRALELTTDETSMRSGMQVAREAIDRALLARSFSVDALAQSARLGDLPPEQSNRVLRRILSLRPHRRAALMDLANSQARTGNLQEAHALQEQLRGLDPENPVLCRNALLLALDRRKPEEVRAALISTQKYQAASEQDLRRLMQRNQLQGRSASSAPLWEALGEGNDLDNPDEAFAAADRANKRGAQVQGDALLTLAHRGYAQRALDRGDLGGALRSLRQALRASARGLEALAGSTRKFPRWRDRHLSGATSRGAEALRLELAGVLAANGQLDAARGELQGLRPSAQDILGLHPTAGDALLSQGLLPSLQGAPR